jgi:hypothetical protein
MAQPGRFIDFGSNLSLRELKAGDHGTRVPGSAVAGGVSTGTLAALGWAIISLHLLLLAANEWMVFDQFRVRMPAELTDALVTLFLADGLRMAAAELIVLVMAGFIALHLRMASDPDADSRRALGVLLVSYVPIALHSMGVTAAFLGGWNLDVWVVSGAGATPDDVARTIRDALPVVLEPLSAGRSIATAGAVILFAVLQRRIGGSAIRPSLAAAVVFGALLTIARLVA